MRIFVENIVVLRDWGELTTQRQGAILGNRSKNWETLG